MADKNYKDAAMNTTDVNSLADEYLATLGIERPTSSQHLVVKEVIEQINHLVQSIEVRLRYLNEH